MTLLPYQTRVIEEHQELDIRLRRLQSFIGSSAMGSLSLEEQRLLIDQSKAMNDYRFILARRIAAWKGEACDIAKSLHYCATNEAPATRAPNPGTATLLTGGKGDGVVLSQDC